MPDVVLVIVKLTLNKQSVARFTLSLLALREWKRSDNNLQ